MRAHVTSTHMHARTHARTHAHTHTYANINSTQPDTLSHRLDTYTLPKPNETPTTHSNNNLDTVYILAQLAQRADLVMMTVQLKQSHNCVTCFFLTADAPVAR